jgi:WD40 repeat protein
MSIRLQIATREDFNVLLLDKSSLQGNTYSWDQELSYEGIYFWRLKAIFPDGESDWSPASRFAISYEIPAPLSPKDGEEVKTLTPTFSWKRAIGAEEYAIQVAKQNNFAKLLVESSSVKGESYTPPRLEADQSYFWRVKGIFGNKGQSDWSKPLSFRIPPQPDPPPIFRSQQVTQDKDNDELEPVFTPDGKRLLYVVEKKGIKEIWCKEVSNREGEYTFAKGTIRITWSVGGCQDKHPSPFPDNVRIAYTSNRLRKVDNLWSKSLGGHLLTELTSTIEGCYGPAVSPDGKKIAYVARNVEGTEYIWIMNADGTGHTQYYEGREPAWTPDGQKLVFSSRRAGRSEIWIMEGDGLNLSRLTISTAGEEYLQPAVCPDGRRVAFVSDKSGNWDIWVMNLDGSGMQQLTYIEFYLT